ncbi:S8 family peptidase [Pseudomonas serbica]|uniref:S8 family peptidase n=1 Tax=Pseudomonas serbica TaxID=2965074 RepID=UPI00237B46D7|nr:S8 family peptidase [Pseudomonas serbica]
MVSRPLVNPVLKLLKSPVPKTVPGGGKNAKGIKSELLDSKRQRLSTSVKNIDKADIDNLTFSGVVHLIAKMDDDSLSPSWTPTDVFDSRSNCRIVAPAYKGFLVEIERSKLEKLSNHLSSTNKTNDMVDISRISSIDAYDLAETLRGSSEEDFWKSLPSEGNDKALNIWLKPFKSQPARKALIKKLKSALSKTNCTLGHPEFENAWGSTSDETLSDNLEDVLDNYLDLGNAVFSLNFSTKQDFQHIISSGAVYRIEPAPSVRISSAPGNGKDPIPATVSKTSPTVLIIDGGVSARSYLPLQKIPLPPLVQDSHANQSHGNKVASLICHAHAWNNNRPLPELDCTFISAQAICKDSAPRAPNHRQLLKYLDQVAQLTSNHAKVWNLSFNQVASKNPKDEVSYLGHEISKLARKYNILPVISAGNNNHNPKRKLICPPADCEAALTISGRTYDSSSKSLGDGCKQSLRGPSPAGMRKPDLSWFSELRMIGGVIETGTSFSTPLVSSLAAHAFSNIKEATPDLVRALLINRAELMAHSNTIGWGTPWNESNLPWFCAPGDVTLAWTSKLQPGFNYYWNDIPIPPELIKDGKFVGHVALTAVLNPLVSNSVGENYFSSRLQTSLQATSAAGSTISLAGSMREDKEKEAIARSDLSKWNPIRNHFKPHKGTGISGSTMRLNARIFTRDLYQYDMSHHSELPPQEVAFVLTLSALDEDSSLYDSTVQSMRAELESAVLNQEIQVS